MFGFASVDWQAFKPNKVAKFVRIREKKSLSFMNPEVLPRCVLYYHIYQASGFPHSLRVLI